MPTARQVTVVALLVASCCYPTISVAQPDSFERPPIDYTHAPVNDPVAQLIGKLDAGTVQLQYEAEHGYLKSLLHALSIPESSQALVFSKTSLQISRISPRRPRAIYFNDDVYVGWCQHGDVIELAASDPKQGAIFYTIKQQRPETPDKAPTLLRDRGQCLTCHASSRTQNVPGFLVRSVYTDRGGQPILGSGTFTTDHTSPMRERWGGWYVTGRHGQMRHMGNLVFTESESRDPNLEGGANAESLEKWIATKPYLNEHSDIVALMVLEHQTQMHNAITAANFETRMALHQSFQMNTFLDRPEGFISDSARRRIASSADLVLRYLLMCDEAPLSDTVQGTAGFATDFASRAIRDSQGRSLRDFDLTRRLFRYPCSYLIYSPAMDALPNEVLTLIYQKLDDILQGRDKSPEYRHLDEADRQAILQILRATKPQFAAHLAHLQ